MFNDLWLHNTSSLNTRTTLKELYKESHKADLFLHLGVKYKFIYIGYNM
jgi:hypothetical protein